MGHIESHRKASKKWRAAHKANGLCIYCSNKPRKNGVVCSVCLKYYRERNKVLGARYREMALQHYGNACVCCGETTKEFLTFDHIDNDGAAHRKESASAGKLANWLVRHAFPPGFQILCWNCNLGKHLAGECPHKRKK